MESTLKKLIIIISAFGFIYPIYFMYNTNYSISNGSTYKYDGTNLGNNFEILEHPVNIIGARNLVAKLRFSTNGSRPPRPLTLKYRNTNFTNHSMKPCGNSQGDLIDLLIIIKSSPGNQDLREMNRNTWANPRFLSKFNASIKYGFIIGHPSIEQDDYPTVTKEELNYEADTNGDLILGDFLDTYHNNTYKTMAGFNWAVNFCPHFKFYISLDDDTYISLTNLLKYLKDPANYNKASTSTLGKETSSVISHSEHLFAGSSVRVLEPIRDNTSAWYISVEAYPYPQFPPYLYGCFLLLSQETVNGFYYLSSYMKEFWVDDVYLGEMANELRVLPTGMDPHVFVDYNVDLKNLTCETNSKVNNHYIAIHDIYPLEKRKVMWDTLNCLSDLKS